MGVGAKRKGEKARVCCKDKLAYAVINNVN